MKLKWKGNGKEVSSSWEILIYEKNKLVKLYGRITQSVGKIYKMKVLLIFYLLVNNTFFVFCSCFHLRNKHLEV